MNRKIDPDTARRIREGIEALGEPPPQDIKPQDMLKDIVPLLQEKRARGWSTSDLANELGKLGFTVAETTVRKYLAAETKKTDARKRNKNRTASSKLTTPTSKSAATVTVLSQPSAHATSKTPAATAVATPKVSKATQPNQQHGGFNEDV